MPPSRGNHSHSDAAKLEQIITEFYTKSLHIILESRTPYVSSRNFSGEQIMSMSLSSPSSSSSSASASASTSAASSVRPRPRDKWFNLALRGYPGAMENLDLWHHSNPEPMVVDVVLALQRPLDWDPTLNFSPTREEIVIERWVLQYDHTRKVKDNHSSGSSRRSSNTTLHTLYKKSMLLLRSLYLTVRLLPAYKVFRDLNSSAQLRTFSLAYHVSSVVEPFPRSAEAEMQRFDFTPIETSAGRLCLLVLYRSSVLDLSSEPTPLTPQVIPDYVGSPLAEPLKRFPSLPVAGLGNHGSPSSLPFSRRHSWGFDLYRASSPTVSFSPSPTHSESNASISNPASRRFPPTSLPPHPPGTSIAHKNTTNFDEYCPSPTFSPSPTPSPPIYIPGAHLSKDLLRSESAPVNIPTTRLSSLPALSNKQYLPPSPPIKNTRSGTLRTDKFTPIQTGAAVEQLFSLGKDDNRKHFGTKISSNDSPRISFSRSSSRSLPDDFDDPEFDCPFDVDDVDMTDPGSRPGSFDQKGHISQDAAVGDLVRMLKKAPPLCPEFSNSVNVPQVSGSEIWSSSSQEPHPAAQNEVSASVTSSGLVRLKTTADALEELQVYREMKKLLLKQGSKSYT